MEAVREACSFVPLLPVSSHLPHLLPSTPHLLPTQKGRMRVLHFIPPFPLSMLLLPCHSLRSPSPFPFFIPQISTPCLPLPTPYLFYGSGRLSPLQTETLSTAPAQPCSGGTRPGWGCSPCSLLQATVLMKPAGMGAKVRGSLAGRIKKGEAE